MSDFDTAYYWNERYQQRGNSGAGSYGGQLEKKLNWLKGLEVNSITEIGCGDFNFGSHLMELYPNATYSGCDISKVVLEKNREKYPQYNFYPAGGHNPPSDLLLCIDVLFHITDDGEYQNMLDTLDKADWKYLAVTAYERDEELGGHVRIRNLDYKRFGEPIIREVVEEDGQMYFYLFKRDKKAKIDLSKVSCCLNTKEAVYPQAILDHLNKFGFGEILIKTHSETPFRKYEMIAKAKYDTIYYQDDDAICPVEDLIANYDSKKINVLMKPSHFESYKDRRMTMGLGWGCLFKKDWLAHLNKYTDKYGFDDVYKRDTEKLLTEIVGQENQNRIVANIIDLPNAMAPGRISMEPQHYSNMDIIRERVAKL